MIKSDIHSFVGMRRDNHQIKQESKYLWEAHNIRLTREDNDTLLSLTNERGNLDTGISFTGKYIGHSVLGNYLVLFTDASTETETINYIYRLEKKTEGTNITYEKKELFKGDLNMSYKYPCQTLAQYEGNLIQKIYWVDNKNQPRVINICKEELTGSLNYNKNSFDFVQLLSLNEKITIKRGNSAGTFAPGSIQYAFTYYNKYGQESNIFYTSKLFYTSKEDRGTSPEDSVSCAFNITFKQSTLQQDFDYIRIYSILRSTKDAIPSVKIVADIKIPTEDYTYIDTGRTGSSIDPSQMLYIGGEDIIAGTLTQKDNTLFLGNITVNRPELLDIKDSIKSTTVSTRKDTSSTSSDDSDRECILTYSQEDIKGFYYYKNTLTEGDVSTFKVGNIYRLGVQFQYKNGKWSQPYYITDYTIGKRINNITPEGTRPIIKFNTDATSSNYKCYEVLVPRIYADLPEDIITKAKNAGYINARPIIVYPSIFEKNVLAQGVVCPTVFSVKDRIDNAPSVQSSWFFRPFSILQEETKEGYNYEVDDNHNLIEGNYDALSAGAMIQNKHYQPLYDGDNRGAEIQNMENNTLETALTSAIDTVITTPNTFFIDQSVVTLNSPDIEFDDDTKKAIKENECSLNIVGIIPLKSSVGDISITTSTPAPAAIDTGFFHKTTNSINWSNRGLISGLFYKSHVVDELKNASSYNIVEYKQSLYEFSFMVYPWHRTGSLNNDVVRGDNLGTRTSVLEKKVISNLRFSPTTWWLSGEPHYTGSIKIFDSNEIALEKLEIPKNSNIDHKLNYYGNVDTLITTSKEYNLYFKRERENTSQAAIDPFTYNPLDAISDYDKIGGSKIGDYNDALITPKDTVRMKYLTTPHAVISFDYEGEDPEGKVWQKILPYYSKDNHIANWIPDSTEYPNPYDIELNDWQAPAEGTYTTYNYESLVISPTGKPEYPSASVGELLIIAGYCSEHKGDITYAIIEEYKEYPEQGTGNVWEIITPTEGTIYYLKGNKYYYIAESDGILRKIYPTLKKQLNFRQDDISPNLYVADIIDDGTQIDDNPLYIDGLRSFLYMAEIVKSNPPGENEIFGGKTDEAIRNNLWLPAGEPVKLGEQLKYSYGDTYYQRYDCLKTYPFSNNEENNIVDIASFMCETYVNIDGRYDNNRGLASNIYVNGTNFNRLNTAYTQQNNFFNYRVLDDDYYKTNVYDNQVTWTLEKSPMSEVDNWTTLTLANIVSLNGDKGKLVSLNVYKDSLVAFQERAVNQLLFNSRVQIPTSDGVPVEISNNYKMEGTRVLADNIGCQDINNIVIGKTGLYFIDNNTDTFYLFSENISDLSSNLGNQYWFKTFHSSDIWNINASNAKRLNYDVKGKCVYILLSNDTDNYNSLCFSEDLQQFTSLMSYSNSVLFNIGSDFYGIDRDNSKLWHNFKGNYNQFFGEYKLPDFTFISNDSPILNKIYDTIEYESDVYNTQDLKHFKSFDWIQAYNEYQDTGIKPFTQERSNYKDISLRKKFRIWRGQIPRVGRQRIRNTWTAIKLGFTKDTEDSKNNFNFVLHSIITKYSI